MINLQTKSVMTENLSFEEFKNKLNIELKQGFLEDLKTFHNMSEEEVRNEILQSAYQDYLNKK